MSPRLFLITHRNFLTTFLLLNLLAIEEDIGMSAIIIGSNNQNTPLDSLVKPGYYEKLRRDRDFITFAVVSRAVTSHTIDNVNLEDSTGVTILDGSTISSRMTKRKRIAAAGNTA
ncbi:hypothetical protein ASPVEDRAFT_76048 [Aspergillus versicolor CBS 583.65]|uniref:Uncharacterized protein n=1 Tax=Aspergillus versicolor CBS 583.65 TaxID=1036611 RepID=A0A1L9PZY9_ASPVE|nr:uncharacterized protein ASPVEDRAFT_76048 [Aspergillus versicolor CBS 583.65]OJJ07065.1 hypothetical protein ASPVEDRAFT_76048 [Aspergillus versicolor CBS 583.65]